MGQAKQKKERLGEWYGRPIEPGHPDFKAPEPPPEYDRESARVSAMPPASEEQIGDESRLAEPRPHERAIGRPRARVGMLGMAVMFGLLAAGVDLGPPPRRR